jgi:hypothetical protein
VSATFSWAVVAGGCPSGAYMRPCRFPTDARCSGVAYLTMEDLALMSSTIIDYLAHAERVAHAKGVTNEFRAPVGEAPRLHTLMMRAMGANPRLVDDSLQAFAATVEMLLAADESFIARVDRKLHYTIARARMVTEPFSPTLKRVGRIAPAADLGRG